MPSVNDQCPCCTAEIDVSGIAPLSVIACPTCRQEFRVLERIAGFTLTDLLAHGPSGAICLGHKPPFEEQVIVKIFWQGLGTSPDYSSRVTTAARLLLAFSHVHVAKVYAVEQKNGVLCVATERVGELTLANALVDGARMPEGDVLTVATQLVDALRAANERGLYHGNIKPTNVLFTPEGVAKLADFGQAVHLSDSRFAPAEHTQLPFYVPPERLALRAEDLRSDIYSLGAVLFHALTGRPPFPGQKAELVAQKHLEHRAPNVQAFNPEISSGTASVVAKMLEKMPNRRHQNCQELLDHLRFAQTEAGLIARPKQSIAKKPGPGAPKTQAIAARSKLWLPLAAAGPAILILGIGSWFVFSRANHDSIPQTAVSTPHVAEPEPISTPAVPVADTAPAGAAFVSPLNDMSFAAAAAAVGGSKPEAAKLVDALVAKPGLDKVMQCWALTLQGIQRLDAGNLDQAKSAFQKLSLATKWVDVAELRISFSSLSEIGAETANANPDIPLTDLRRLSLLISGLVAWTKNDPAKASAFLKEYAAPDTSHISDGTIGLLTKLASARVTQFQKVAELEARGVKVRGLPDAYSIQFELANITGPMAPAAQAARQHYLAARAKAAQDVAELSMVDAYKIVNRASGLCLTQPDSGGDKSNPGKLGLHPFRPGSLTQCWRLPRFAYAQTAIVSALDGNGVTVPSEAKDAKETRAQFNNFNEGSQWQGFIFKKVDGRYFTIAGENTGKFLGVATGTSGEASEISLSDDGRAIDKQWEFVPVPDAYKWVAPSDHYEIEWLPLLQKSDDAYRVVDEKDWSGHFATIFDAFGPGAFVTFKIPQVKPGSYTVQLRTRCSDIRGQFQISMGPEKGPMIDVGKVIDPFATESGYKEFELGAWTNPKLQDVAIKFLVTGKNPASKTYMLCLDYLKLVPAN